MKLVTSPAELPQRKHKTKSTPLDDHEAYLKLKHLILEGRMKPMQQVGLFFGPEDQKLLDMKFPWRTATERLRKFVKELGAEKDYDITKFQTDTPGVWFVSVTYTPPEADVAPRRRRHTG